MIAQGQHSGDKRRPKQPECGESRIRQLLRSYVAQALPEKSVSLHCACSQLAMKSSALCAHLCVLFGFTLCLASEEVPKALDADDQCASASCAVNALQHRVTW